MIEQELASIMRVVLVAADNPCLYYSKVQEDFQIPSVYFPVPEIISQGDTLSSYGLEYLWTIKFFAKDNHQAAELAAKALNAISQERNRVPLVDGQGMPTGESLLLRKVSTSSLQDSPGAARLSLVWISHRQYATEAVAKMMDFALDIYNKAAEEDRK